MSIINAKVSFSRIGCTSCQNGNIQKSEVYVPKVNLYLEGRKTAKTGYMYMDLERTNKNIKSWCRFEKKAYKGLAICEKFVVICTTTEYITVGEDAQEHTAISAAEAGRIVNVNAETFLCVKGTTLTAYDFNCKIVGSRELSEDEIKLLGIQQ